MKQVRSPLARAVGVMMHNLRDENQVIALMAEALAVWPLDILFNNASSQKAAPLAAVDASLWMLWNDIISIDPSAAFHMMKATDVAQAHAR